MTPPLLLTFELWRTKVNLLPMIDASLLPSCSPVLQHCLMGDMVIIASTSFALKQITYVNDCVTRASLSLKELYSVIVSA